MATCNFSLSPFLNTRRRLDTACLRTPATRITTIADLLRPSGRKGLMRLHNANVCGRSEETIPLESEAVRYVVRPEVEHMASLSAVDKLRGGESQGEFKTTSPTAR